MPLGPIVDEFVLVLRDAARSIDVEELSVGPHQVPSVRKAIRSLSHAECSAMADDAMKAPLSADILKMTDELAKKYYADLFE